MCPVFGQEVYYGPKSSRNSFHADHARSRFSWPRPGNRRKYPNKTIRGSFREAQTYLNGKLQERNIGRLPRAAAINLNQHLDQWLTTAAKPRLRPKSYTDYEALLRLHIRPVLGTRPLGAIVQFDIQSIYAQMFERGLSARTIEYTNAVLQSAFRQAVRWKMLAEDPRVGVDLPRMKRREMEALSVEECRRFLVAARGTEWFALYALALTTGMRPSEYLALHSVALGVVLFLPLARLAAAPLALAWNRHR